jgi:uncharacterized GH25 family protein
MRSLILAGGLACLVSPAFAHDTWLLPADFTVPPGATVSADMTSAMAFPRGETAIKPGRIARSGLRLAGRTSALRPGPATATALRLRAAVPAAGVAALWVELHPRTLDLEDALVEEYLREIGAWETAGAEWRAAGRQPWRETYVKCTKSFVRVGDAAGASPLSWSEPVGLALELVPEVDPTAVGAGSKLAVRLLRGGAAMAGQPVVAEAAGGKPVLAQTDKDGRASFVLDREGPWLIKSTALRRKGDSAAWESEFTTLTVMARPPAP